MPPFHVLAIDDEVALLNIFQGILTPPKYRVTVCTNGDAGLHFFRRSPPHVVILDVNMPGKDGLSTMSEMRALHPEVPILLITGAISLSQSVADPANPPDAYLGKPFKAKEMLRIVDYLLDAQSANTPCEKNTRDENMGGAR